jgi:hypothetical protein
VTADAPVRGAFVADPGVAAPIQTDLVAWYAEGFTDRFGDRLLLFDSSGPALELLRLNPQLAAVPGFEAALRARVEDLETFSHPVFARVRCVTTLDDPRPQLALVSELVPGERLSQVLQTVERHQVRPDPGAAVWLIRRLLPAVAALHERGDGIAHGLLGSERIVVTPEGGLAITEYVLAEGVQRLGLSVGDLWRHFGIAARDTPEGPRLDAGSDLVQLGLLAVSVLLGRPLRDDDYPTGLSALIDEACSSQHWTLAPMLRPWLARALGVEGTPFASIAEAQAQLDVLLPGVAGGWSPRLLPRADEPSLAAPALRPAAGPPVATRQGIPDAAWSTGPTTRVPASGPGGASRMAGRTDTRSTAGGLQTEPAGATRSDVGRPDTLTITRLRRRLAAVGLLAGAEAVALVLLLAMSGWPSSPAASTGVSTDAVFGVPPAVESAPEGSGISDAAQPENDTARAVAEPSAAGWLVVSSDVPVNVFANGTLLGATLDGRGRFQLQAGDQEVFLTNDAVGYGLMQKVHIRAGGTIRVAATRAREASAGSRHP